MMNSLSTGCGNSGYRSAVVNELCHLAMERAQKRREQPQGEA